MNRGKEIIIRILVAAAIFLSATAVVSCGDDSTEGVSLATNINTNEIIISNSGGGTTNFSLTSNAKWSINVNSGDWLIFAPASGEGNAIVDINFEANGSENSRSANFTITAGSGNDAKTLTYTVRQVGTTGEIDEDEDYLRCSTTAISNISGNGETGRLLNVYSNLAWTATSEASWVTLTAFEGEGDGVITFDVAENPDNSIRTTEIKIKPVGNDSVDEIVVSVSQLANGIEEPDPFLSVDPNSVSDIPADGSSGLSFSVSSNVAWSVSVDSGAVSWLTVTTASGTDDGTVYYNVAANTSTVARNATITIRDNEDQAPSVTFKVNQKGKEEEPIPGSDGWVETPSFYTTSSTQYVTHYITMGGKQARNFSLLWDKNEKIAYWVAYPMHECYIGGSGRNEDWNYDPLISRDYQPNLNSSYLGSNYDRGHQIGSSDRTISKEANKQTFYFTNMTPQFNKFNQGIWNKLEKKVQSTPWMCSDTLYVVTGAALIGTVKYDSDKSGTKVAIPSHYYKVLLRSKSGNTGKPISQLPADDIICVGFWFEHHTGWQTSDALGTQYMKSVEDIEELTGYTFFPTVPDEVKKSFKASDWGM